METKELLITKQDIKAIKAEFSDLTHQRFRWNKKLSKQQSQDFLSKDSVRK